jgi:hypothetical protein
MELLKETIKDFSDEELVDQYLNHREEYTPEAFSIIKKSGIAKFREEPAGEKATFEIKTAVEFGQRYFIQFENHFPERSDGGNIHS